MKTHCEKSDLKNLYLMLIVFAIVLCSYISYSAGKKNKEQEIKQRALKENLTGSEVERIIFNSI